MIFGLPFGCPYGRPEEWIVHASCVQIQGSDYLLSWTVDDSCDGYYQVAVDGGRYGQPIYCVAGVPSSIVLPLSAGSHLISIVCQGQFADTAVMIRDEIDYYASGSNHGAKSIQARIVAIPSLIIDGDAGQLSGLSLVGLRRGNNISPVQGRSTWGQWDVSLTTDGGVHTLALSESGRVMVSGSRTGDGSIVLAGAGVVGSVTLAYISDFTDGKIYARWPAQLKVYVKPGTAFVAGDFAARSVTAAVLASNVATLTSTAHHFVAGQTVVINLSNAAYNGIALITAVTTNTFSYSVVHADIGAATVTGTAALRANATIADDGYSNNFVFKSFAIGVGGTFYVVIHQVGDDGNESTGIQSGGQAVTTQTLPGEPTGLAYFTGGFANTQITFTAPAGSVDSYNIYDTGDTGVFDWITPALNVSTAGHHVLAAISGAFAGIRYIWVRSVLGGVEEGNLNLLAIEYLGGSPVSPRPPTPAAGLHFTSSGRTLTVPVTVVLDPSLAVPTQLFLYIYKSGTSVSYAGGASIALTNPAGAKVLSAMISATATSDGLYYFQVRTKTFIDEPDGNAIEYGPVELTTAALGDPVFAAAPGA